MEKEYYGYVYLILDQKHNKIYIGQKKGKIEKTQYYFGSGVIIKSKIKSRGTYFLKKIILGVCSSKEELLECETECKHFFNSFYPNGYNILEKDTYGDTFTNNPNKEEIRKKISISSKGKVNSPETRLKLSIANTGKKSSEETKIKIGLIHKNKKMTQDSRKKMSISRTGKNNYSYKKLNYKFLILEYFDIISAKNLIIKYNEVFTENIHKGIYYRKFIKLLSFPSNNTHHKNLRDPYLKFVEENKHKIDWYIENYERLEEEYNNNKFKVKWGI